MIRKCSLGVWLLKVPDIYLYIYMYILYVYIYILHVYIIYIYIYIYTYNPDILKHLFNVLHGAVDIIQLIEHPVGLHSYFHNWISANSQAFSSTTLIKMIFL